MKKLHSNQSGFSVIELLFVLVILAAIGAAGYFVVKHNDKHSSKSVSSVTHPAMASSYSDWKSYCDSAAKVCFKYPATWTTSAAASPPSGGVVETAINTSASVDAQYADYITSYGFPTSLNTANPLATATPPANVTLDLPSTYSFYVTSVNSVPSSTSYKAVSGYYVGTSENIPSVILMSAAKAASLSVKANQTATLQPDSFDLSAIVSQSNKVVMFGAGPITTTAYTAAEAKAWLSSADGLTALKVVESIH